MKKNKMCLRMILAAALLLSALPVWADNTLTQVNPEGDTAVTADVANGDVSYIISIPDTINFGKLTSPADNSSPHELKKGFKVTTTQVQGLSPGSQVVVLMKDAASADGFQIVGKGSVNTGKSLSYSVLNSSGTDISTAKQYPNGYLFGGFSDAPQELNGTLQLDQNQLYGIDLSSWAGNYQGTIRFFSKIASIKDIS